MTTDRLIYLPLGGAGEIGMNAYVYGYGKPGKERLILVDIGVAIIVEAVANFDGNLCQIFVTAMHWVTSLECCDR